MIKTIFLCFISLVFGLIIGKSLSKPIAINWDNPPEWLTYPDIAQFQRWVGIPENEVDNKMCDGWRTPGHSDTIDLWMEHVFNQYAEPHHLGKGQ